jgi:hypothetical protein
VVQQHTLEEAVERALHGEKTMVLCPAHDDSTPSLSVAPGETQPVLFNCHAGCKPEDIIGAGGLDWSQVMVPDDPSAASVPVHMWTPRGTASHIYRYTDARGTLLYEVLRVPLPGGKKTILQRHPDESAKSGYVWNIDGCERVLYRLPQVLEAVKEGRTIHVAEGEKCADALQAAIPDGEQATTNPMGAGKWEDHYGEMLSGATVVIYADADEPGRAHARLVRENLLDHGCTVTVKEPPPGVLRSGKSINDVADHLEAGKGLEALLETTPEAERERSRTGIDILDLIKRPRGRTEFVIPMTLAKGERLILIGFEGTGKSTLCRQIGAMVAGGMHPWTGQEIEPKKVLYIDGENHPDQVDENWSELVGLMARHDRPIERGQLIVMEEWESSIDLSSAEGGMWLTERVHAYQPDLVIMGPLTNLSGKDLRDDEPVRRMRNAINAARVVCNSAFIMEHHAPHKGPMDKERQVRPYGSSLFLKWPDYGYGLKPTEIEGVYEWWKNRGPRVRSRMWPGWLREGKPGTDEFPWMTCLIDENGQLV